MKKDIIIILLVSLSAFSCSTQRKAQSNGGHIVFDFGNGNNSRIAPISDSIMVFQIGGDQTIISIDTMPSTLENRFRLSDGGVYWATIKKDTLQIPSATEFIKVGDSVYNLKELLHAQAKNEVLEEMLLKQVNREPKWNCDIFANSAVGEVRAPKGDSAIWLLPGVIDTPSLKKTVYQFHPYSYHLPPDSAKKIICYY